MSETPATISATPMVRLRSLAEISGANRTKDPSRIAVVPFIVAGFSQNGSIRTEVRPPLASRPLVDMPGDYLRLIADTAGGTHT
jgi:hypothetical protein